MLATPSQITKWFRNMAKRKVNKSQEIRDYVIANPTAKLKDVVAAMKKKNLIVSIATVANVKSKAGLTRRRKKSKGKVGRPSTVKVARTNDVTLDALVDAKRLVAKAGSTQRAIEMIRAIEKLDSIAG